jgi:hypothetical protein
MFWLGGSSPAEMRMNWQVTKKQVPTTVAVVAAALVGAAGGLVGTALALGSVEFGIFGAVGGAVASMIASLAALEHPEG